MLKDQALLKSLVGLKRKGAEQRLRLLMKRLEENGAGEQALQAALKALDTGPTAFEDRRLAHLQGATEHLLSRLATVRARREGLLNDIAAARQALRRAIHAESQLSG